LPAETANRVPRNGEGRLIEPAFSIFRDGPVVYFLGWNSAFAMIAPLVLTERMRIV
jgi:hypothetical protein